MQQLNVVVYQVKDTIFWKQITTHGATFCELPELFIKSKIQFFESKSQLLSLLIREEIRCLSSQRYNFLKANHNIRMRMLLIEELFIKSKIQFFESKSQQTRLAVLGHPLLFIKSKIQFFESKSQLQWTISNSAVCCLSSQRYNFLKANHNLLSVSYLSADVVYQVKDTIFWKQITTYECCGALRAWLFIKSKIQFFESKSQLYISRDNLYQVVYQVKDTIFWKQITTANYVNKSAFVLFIKSKIQFFESKSQPQFDDTNDSFGCLSSQRYNFLKANHN